MAERIGALDAYRYPGKATRAHSGNRMGKCSYTPLDLVRLEPLSAPQLAPLLASGAAQAFFIAPSTSR